MEYTDGAGFDLPLASATLMVTDMESVDLEVRKEGVYKKLKTSKKKYFILREKTRNAPASLEYYDSEKKVKSDAKPKRSVSLVSCFSINAKFDAKNPYTLVLFTQDDCLGMVFDSEKDQQEWLQAVQSLLSESGAQASRFDHVWQVVVKQEGLASGKTLQAGTYRLCLSKKTLTLVPINKKMTEVEFQLATIRKLAHKKTFFMLESGTAAATGAGELWMQVEDSVVAHNIHDTVLKAMRSNPGENITLFRGRSHTHGTSERPHRSSTKRNSIDGGASTLPRHQKAKSMHVPVSEFATSPSLKRQSHSPHKAGNMHMRPKSSFVDFSTISPGQSPHIMSPLSQEMRDRTDSWESRGSHRTESSSISEDYDTDHALNFPNRGSVHPQSLDTTDYLSMNTASSSNKALGVSPTPERSEGYMEMSSPVSSAPCLKTLAASPIMPSDSGYIDMQPVVTTLHKIESNELLRPDKVPSLLSDSESVEEFPKRTYSLGSKPSTTQPTLGQSSAYMDMHCSLDKGNPKTWSAPHLFDELTETSGSYPALSSSNVSQSSSRSATPCGIPEQRSDLMELNFESKGTGSRESLSDFRSRTSSGSSRDIGYHTSSFEADFRDRTDSSCSRDSAYRIHSIDKFRHRTQTVCQDSLRTQASNLGVEESMRPRSFSHGTSRFRELSKRLKEKTLRHPSSSDHAKVTKRISKNPSRESIHDQRVSMADSEYIDINVVGVNDTESSTRGKPSEKPHVMRLPEDEYMVINPAEVTGDTDILHMRNIKHVYKTQDTAGVPSDPAASATSVKMRSKSMYNRKESSFNKHYSSSESVSSNGSSDLVAKSNKMPVSGMSLNTDYYEFPQPGSGGDAYMKFSQIQKQFNLPSQKTCSEDSYSIVEARDSQGGSLYDELPSEPASLGEILQGLDKVVSPIREEDNEALFGPKPSALTRYAIEKLQQTLKHEYVNVHYDEGSKNAEVPEASFTTNETLAVAKAKARNVSSGDSKVKDKTEAAPRSLGTLPWNLGPMPTSHEYCEINFAEKDNHSHTHNMAPEKKEAAGTGPPSAVFDNFKSKTGNNQNEDSNKKTVSTPAPFELLPLTMPSSDKKQKKPSPPPEDDVIPSLDVFNLGALPSASSTPVRPGCSLSDATDNNNSKSPELMPNNKSPTLTTSSASGGNNPIMAHRGSVTSLASLDSVAASTRLRSHSSQTCLPSMDRSSDRLSYQEPSSSSSGIASGAETGGEAIRRQSSQASLSSSDPTSQQPLNYATLDLSSSQDESSFPQFPSTEQVSPGIKSRAQVVSKMIRSQENNTGPISYAQIDFEQCNISSSSAVDKDKV